MGLPLNKRDYDVFISYSHADRPFVERLYQWLKEDAGLEVWWDDRNLPAGGLLAIELQKAIGRCRALLLIATDDAVKRGWVEAEYNAAMNERAEHKGFRVIALRLRNAVVSNLMQGVTWIDVPDGVFDERTAGAILNAFYPGGNSPNPAKSHDVYISASWHADDAASATAVCRFLDSQGFRLVGDSKDQKGFGEGDRVQRIVASCGAFVAIIPYRNDAVARPGQTPYKYFLQEIELAAQFGIPSIVIADPRVRRVEGQDADWLRMDTQETIVPSDVKRALSNLWQSWVQPQRPHYVFCALDLDSADASASGPVRQLIQQITSMPTVVGDEVHEGNSESVNYAVRRSVCEAFLVIADLTDDNVNACIEAGMALAVGANIELIAKGPQRRPPFMLRERNMPTYEDKVEQLGVIHRICRKYRRRVINAEIV